MKTKEELETSAATLRKNLEAIFGDGESFTQAIGSSIRAKIECKKLEMIDSHLSSFQPIELAMFLKAWKDLEIRGL